MIRFILKRLLQAIPVLLAVAVITFLLIHAAPGGPFAEEKAVPPEVLKHLNERYKLDQPIHVQFYDYISHALQGDLGPSFKYPGRSVNELIAAGFPITLELGCYGPVVRPPYRHRQRGLRVLGTEHMAGLRPHDVCHHRHLPARVRAGPVTGAGLRHLAGVAPGCRLGIDPGRQDPALPSPWVRSMPPMSPRLSRGGMLETLSRDFIRTARAKGMPESIIIFRHAMRVGLLPVVSFLGPALAGLLSGSFVVETIFQVPGLGRYFRPGRI